MEQTEIFEMFAPVLKASSSRRRITDIVAVILLLVISGFIVNGLIRNAAVPKIESLTIVPNSVITIGPAENVSSSGGLAFCPGDLMTVRYQITIDGAGAIYADDVVHHQNSTVKFSTVWRDVVEAGTRTYDNEWLIPARPDVTFDGKREWVAGTYQRVISVAASNIYISRYVPPATFDVDFEMAEPKDCP